MMRLAVSQLCRRPWRSILAAAAALAIFATAGSAATREWATLTNCVLVQNPANDGDSFHVMYEGKEYVFRLYFVDCPEEDDRYSDRVAAQAAYFGVNEKQAHALAEQAAAFTRAQLSKPFTITTRWQDALGNSKLGRQYGVISVGGQDLGELLVANGLARIHGVSVGGIGKERVDRLKALEAQAKAQRRGAWSLAKS